MSFDILLSPPDVGPLEEERVLAALRSGWVAPAGPELDAFEEDVAALTGVRYAVGLASGTAALHLALTSWGIGPGDVVPVSTLTFIASVNAIRYCGATPFFVDVDPATGNMSPPLLRSALDQLAEQGRRVPAVLAVDLLGKCADYSALVPLLSGRGIRLLSDAAESVGASHHGGQAGSFGDAAVLSFNGNKIITSSGGGMLLSYDEHLAAHVRKLSTQAREPVTHYEHVQVGYNYRLSNVLAALGRAQLCRLDEIKKKRRAHRERYRALAAAHAGVEILGGADDAEDNCWLTAIVVDPHLAGVTVADLAEALALASIESRPVWKPMHQQPVNAGLPALLDGSADRLFAQGLTLPSGTALSERDIDRVVHVLEAGLARRS